MAMYSQSGFAVLVPAARSTGFGVAYTLSTAEQTGGDLLSASTSQRPRTTRGTRQQC